ncbi:hypothetical protein GGE16_001048 [Rhizobium leguminosarum]|uniref:Uncharacterized protein n=1 Tax=Rhizobium leguminosarum TaxID=384 RepID=A0AAE2SV14_RHILE|nr:hypothetical protein [Rhizobium leguminosarum]MBB4432996.1 hypothetical protein [Rhizobium esperanzae]MBB4294875.1 hypothetical protein [Rhizobium leguminosarum]MBB4306268.1 hypothetical protein [Rhizobium leguminosarum]MBB4418151.1 hypothetical protein [Rhizobium leguminosarum]
MAQGQGETICYTPAIMAALCPLWQSCFDERERQITIPCIRLLFVKVFIQTGLRHTHPGPTYES